MAFQHTVHNRRKDQQIRAEAEEFTPAFLRNSATRSSLHEPLLRHNSLQENVLGSQRLRQPRLHTPTHLQKAAFKEAVQQRQVQSERPSDSAHRRQRLSFSRWHMMISSRYKTELCRQFSEDGDCPFEDKCLFAHGQAEIRPLPRHPKYKTELCRDFHQVGFCSFGPRCNFIHSTADMASLTTAILRIKGRSETPDSGIESCEDQSALSASASPIMTPNQTHEETFFHFPEGLYREITEGTADDVPETID